MVRTAKKAAAPSATVLSGPSVRVGITSTNEVWSTCTLDDGTIIEIRPAIVEVRRLRNKFNDDGSPVYVVKSALLINTETPKKLRKGAAKKTVKKGTKRRSAKK